MKNNRITAAQFWVSMLLCSFCALIFCGNIPSIWEILVCAGAVLFNIIFCTLYKGSPCLIIRIIIAVYFSLTALLCFVRFNEYMYKSLGYGPYWLVTLIMLVFLCFCTVKGIEPVFRAGGILLFFILLALIYTFICCFWYVPFAVSYELSINLLMPFILIFPSAAYVWFYDNIIPQKNNVKYIYALIIFAAIIYFMSMSAGETGEFPFQRIAQAARIDVFRGADCMLLGIFTISGLFIISNVVIALFRRSQEKYLPKVIYLIILGILTISAFLFDCTRPFLYNNIFLFAVLITVVFTLLIELIKNRVNKNS